MSRDDPDFGLAPNERASYGCTVTAINPATGHLLTLEAKGTALAAIRKIAAILDGMEEDWKIRSVSTPQTIMRDLYAHRYPVRGTRRVRVGVVEPKNLPESNLLARIGRVDLLYDAPPTRPVYQGPTAWQR